MACHGAETEFLGHFPASTAAAAMLCTVTEVPGTSCFGISTETELHGALA